MRSEQAVADVMAFDVLIVGAGPAGLSAACRLMQLARKHEQPLQVCVIDKGSEIGAHIISGALLETRALDELFPDWTSRQAPVRCAVDDDRFYMLGPERARRLPPWLLPDTLHNDGNYIISLGNLCRWLAQQAEDLGVEIYSGFSAADIKYAEDGRVIGVVTGALGLDKQGAPKANHVPGMELRARYTLFAEGSHGHLGQQLIKHFQLDKDADPQHYALGLKEIWEVPASCHAEGTVIHGSGWPLHEDSHGGFFLYHGEQSQIAVGLIVDLNYRNPYLSPYDEFQRLKHHPLLKPVLEQGQRISYGARCISKGGFNSLPRMSFPGGLLIGCDAGTLNMAKIKGIHTAMKSGMLAAEVILPALRENADNAPNELPYTPALQSSWLYTELYSARNFTPALHHYGPWLGGAYNWLSQRLRLNRLPWTLHDSQPDHAQLQPARAHPAIAYPKPDGQLSFDKMSSVYLSNTYHEEDQPCHLQLLDRDIPMQRNLPEYAEPAQRYCPAGVYEVITENAQPRLQINAQNCLHCKACAIKDPAQNIRWVAPEGGGGPNYPNM